MPEEILEEEQLELLGKMVQSLTTELSEREMKVFDLLVEHLSQRAARLRRISQRSNYAHVYPSTDNRDEETEGQLRRSGKERLLRKKDPADIVRAFIDSFNNRDFETEYYCLARDFSRGGRRPNSVDEYIEQRSGSKRERTAGFDSKEIKELSAPHIQAGKATVECVETHSGSEGSYTLFREYTLVHEDGIWRILDFITQKRTPVSTRHKA